MVDGWCARFTWGNVSEVDLVEPNARNERQGYRAVVDHIDADLAGLGAKCAASHFGLAVTVEYVISLRFGEKFNRDVSLRRCSSGEYDMPLELFGMCPLSAVFAKLFLQNSSNR